MCKVQNITRCTLDFELVLVAPAGIEPAYKV